MRALSLISVFLLFRFSGNPETSPLPFFINLHAKYLIRAPRKTGRGTSECPRGTDVEKMEEKIEEFEEIEDSPSGEKESSAQNRDFSKDGEGGSSGGGARPEFRVMQPDRDKDGNSILKNVGGMWKKTSKNGNDFYVLSIGRLSLLVFKNDRQGGFDE
jgi:hypothetical protein